MRIAYCPDLGVFPVDPPRRDGAPTPSTRFEEAGATVEEVDVASSATQRELADLWCRLIIPLNVAGLRGASRDSGIDLLGEHRSDLPPEYMHWVDHGCQMPSLELARDQEIRTEVCDAVAGRARRYDLLVCPTLPACRSPNADDGNTRARRDVEGEEVEPLIGWCMTYLFNYTGHPAASVPAGLVDGLPVGMQIIGRRYADADVLAASAAFERLRPWRETYAIPRDRAI